MRQHPYKVPNVKALVLLLAVFGYFGQAIVENQRFRLAREEELNSGMIVSMPHTVAEVDAFKLILQEQQDRLSYKLQCTKPSDPREVTISFGSGRYPLEANASEMNTVRFQALFPTNCRASNPPIVASTTPHFVTALKPGDTFWIGLEVKATPQKRLTGTVYRSEGYKMGTDGKLRINGREEIKVTN